MRSKNSVTLVERMCCRFKNWRHIATRFNRNIKNFVSAAKIAATIIRWLN